MRRESAPRPSLRFGARQAVRLWKMVLAVWLAPAAAFAPALLIVDGALGPALSQLPEAAADAPADEALLIAWEVLPPVAPAIAWAVVAGLVAVWMWTVLWHAGVACWQVWSGPQARPRLAEVLGLGLLWWWRYLRLAMVAVAAAACVAVPLWGAIWVALMDAHATMAETRMVWLLAAGLGASALVLVVCWTATLRAAWLLTAPGARSALLAWARGLAGSIRHPATSLGHLVLWAAPALALSLLPALAGMGVDALRWGAPALAVLALSGLLRAFCWVALYCSFAPVSGLIGEPADGDAASYSTSFSRFGPTATTSAGQPAANSLKFSM